MNKQQLKTIWILYLALMSSIVIYTVVAVMIDAQGGPRTGELESSRLELFQYVFLAAGAAATVVGMVIPGLVVRAPRGAALPYERLVTKKILQWALSESVAIFGLVLFFLTRDLDYMYIFAAWSAVVMLVHGPYGLRAIASKAEGSSE